MARQNKNDKRLPKDEKIHPWLFGCVNVCLRVRLFALVRPCCFVCSCVSVSLYLLRLLVCLFACLFVCSLAWSFACLRAVLCAVLCAVLFAALFDVLFAALFAVYAADLVVVLVAFTSASLICSTFAARRSVVLPVAAWLPVVANTNL